MTMGGTEWLRSGRGIAPQQQWSFTLDAPLTDARLARENGDILAADQSGGIYRIDRRGRVASLTRGSHPLRILAWSETGTAGAAAFDDASLCWLSPRLQFAWTLEFPDSIVALGMDPHGQHACVGLASGTNLIINADGRQVARFQSIRPLAFVQFVTTERALVGAAEYGLLGRYGFDGSSQWQEKLWTNVGDIAIAGDGRSIYVAGFMHGVQLFDGEGNSRSSWLPEGTVSRVASTFLPGRVAVATLEQHLYWLDREGEVVSAVKTPDAIARLLCGPLGDWLVCAFNSGRLVRLNYSAGL